MLDYKAPHSMLEWLADAQHVSANNPNDLPAYTTYDAGVTAQLTRGTLTFAATNISNTYAGVFSSPANAVPYTTEGGFVIPNIARPLTPRAIWVPGRGRRIGVTAAATISTNAAVIASTSGPMPVPRNEVAARSSVSCFMAG